MMPTKTILFDYKQNGYKYNLIFVYKVTPQTSSITHMGSYSYCGISYWHPFHSYKIVFLPFECQNFSF